LGGERKQLKMMEDERLVDEFNRETIKRGWGVRAK